MSFMPETLTTYAFSEQNALAVVLIPGYSGGLSSPILQGVSESLVISGGCDVLGLPLSYENQADGFEEAQCLLISTINEFAALYPHKKLVLVGKSLGGSLCLHNLDRINIAVLVVLGPSLVLGWPQRISLLASDNPHIPDYKAEWQDVLTSINIPLHCIAGDQDSLTDNDFLADMALRNTHIGVTVLKGADHNLADQMTKSPRLPECVAQIHSLLARI